MIIPPYLRAIFNKIDQAVDKAETGANDRTKRTNEQQQEVAASVQALTNEFKTYQTKEDEAEKRKDRRERWTIGSLIVTASVTVGLAVIGTLQWLTLEKTDETNRVGLRPYISGIGLNANTERWPMYWALKAIFENSGGTPPIQMRYVIRSSADFSLDPEEIYQHPSETDAFFEPNIAPKGQIQVEAGMPVVTFFNDRKTWYVSGAIHYRDQFKGTSEHISKFCFAVVAVKDTSANLTRPGYDPCPYWNCIDEQACANDRARYDNAVHKGEIRPTKKSSDSPTIPLATAIPSANGMIIKAIP